MKHTDHCIKVQEDYKREKELFERVFPNYCRNCRGWGGFGYYYDPSPAGVSLGSGSMYDWEPCGHCIENALCPLCGKDIVEGEMHWFCPSCGWIEGESEGLRDEPECYCWELETYGKEMPE